MPTVRTEDPAVQLVKSPIHILDKDFSPLVKLMGALHPSLVDQAQMMLEYFDSVEERLRPAFHFVGVDEAPAEKNRFKVSSYFSFFHKTLLLMRMVDLLPNSRRPLLQRREAQLHPRRTTGHI